MMSDEQPTTESESPTDKKVHKEASRWEVYFPFGYREDRHAIHVASFPPIVYFWPAILVFFFCFS